MKISGWVAATNRQLTCRGLLTEGRNAHGQQNTLSVATKAILILIRGRDHTC
jgi:hypothetical protein